ncbi:MAG: TonB-dependent receptor [Sphingomonadales bacterium]|nr:TonB-dependent receptor [Sphingomonadales bacterium]MDE2623608.1 TonB-dependent receptor [Betaproteobacteria bacterium]
MNTKRHGTLMIALVAGLNATTCLAQVRATDPADANGSSASDQSAALDEIVVVAQKRSESLQNVPVAVGVVQGANISRLDLSSFEQMSRYVPNLTISDGASGNRITMRGISSGTNRGFEQSVGLFVDGIYAGRALQFSVPFFDVDRVEVLRGPQGVLFGKNTVAGAISVISARPRNENSLELSAGEEVRFGRTELTGILNRRLSDSLRIRVAGRLSIADHGYLRNSETGRSETRDNEDLARASLAWDPGNGIKIDAKYEFSRRLSRGGRFQLISAGPYDALFKVYDPHYDTSLDLHSSGAGLETGTTKLAEPVNDLKSHNVAVRVEVPVGNARIVSQSGFSAYTNHTLNSESDFTPVPLIDFINDEDFKQFSQEMRLESPSEARLRYTFGLYYQTNHYVSGAGYMLNGSVVGYPKTRWQRSFDQHDNTYSAFGELSYAVTPGLRVIGGLRWSHETKRADRSVVVLDYFTGLPQTSPALLGFTKAAVSAQNYSNSQSLNERQLTPSATLQYEAAPGIMLYGRFSKGNKSGGFDASDSLGTAPPYLAESVTGYEGGVKMSFGRSATLNLAAFTSTFANLQVQSFNGITFLTTNAGKARSQGVEADGRWKVSRNLLITASLAYLDAKFLDYTGASCTTDQTAAFKASGAPGPCVQDLSGRPLTDAPKWSGSFNLNYSVPVSGDWELESNLGMNFKSAAYVAPDLDPLGLQKGYATFDASIAIIAPSDRFSLTLLAKNISDKRAMTYLVNAPLFNGAKGATIIEPRTVMIRAGVKF